MKKVFPTYIHDTALSFDSILFSAGRIGFQVELSLVDLQKVVNVRPATLI